MANWRLVTTIIGTSIVVITFVFGITAIAFEDRATIEDYRNSKPTFVTEEKMELVHEPILQSLQTLNSYQSVMDAKLDKLIDLHMEKD